MFEAMTFENIMTQMLKSVPEDMDKRQGSIIYDALAPVGVELAKIYVDLDMVINNCFADTATRPYLIMLGAERGIMPYSATKGVFKGEFNINVDIGARFNLEQYNYRVTEKISDCVFKLECETEGSEANGLLGNMTPLEYIEGLTFCRLTQMLIPGEDEEDTEHFRKRYFELLDSRAFGGNIQDYKEQVQAIEGVGQVRVYSSDQWQGAGTVGIKITDSDNLSPTQTLIEKVQASLDPNNGDGSGIAPIGHIVTVEGAESELININATLLLAQDISQDLVRVQAKEIIEKYLTQVNAAWQNEDIYLYTAKLNALLMNIEGVVSVSGLTVNNKDTYLYLKDKICKPGQWEIEVEYAEQ